VGRAARACRAAARAGGQFAAAREAATYVADQAAAQDVEPAEFTPDPRAFTGVTADGRPLASLLIAPAIVARTGIGAGLTLDDALRRGGAWLALAIGNETTQAGNNAAFTGITAQIGFTAHVRVLTPPSCGRCAILAGRVYRWSQGFARHPGCDCKMLPVSEALDADRYVKDPQSYFDSLTPQQQAKFAGSEAGAQAIRDGANPAQVVNVYAKRNRRTEVNGSTFAPNSGLHTFDTMGTRLQYTNEGANVTRGRFGKAMGEATGQTDQAARRARGLDPTPDRFELSDVKRLTPRSIYQLAGDDRALAIDLLRRYGYVT
jgi:hypothetical protein